MLIGFPFSHNHPLSREIFNNVNSRFYRVLCETVKEFVAKVGQNAKDYDDGEDSISCKCAVLNQKLDNLLKALNMY